MPRQVPLIDLLDTLVLFANNGGASASQVAWDLGAEEHHITQAWQQAINDGLISPAGHDHQHLIYQLTAAGWAARYEHPAGA
jgi:transposase-like protein